MNENITVFVNNRPVKIYRGMSVKHALIAMDYSLFKAAESGEMIVEDTRGYRVGLEGALQDGARIFIKRAG